MAIKTFINGQENGAITFYGDTEPCSVYVNGEKQDNISYVPQSIEGVSSVQYSSEYKKNIRTMQIDGNTTQYQGEAIATKAIAIPTFESETLTGNYPSETPLEISFDAPYTITLSNFNGIEINGVIDNSIEVVLATSKEDIYNINTTVNPVYRLYSYGVNTPHEVTSATTLYIGLAVESGSVLTDNLASAWEQLQSATLTASKTVNAPSLDAPQPIQNAGDNGIDLTLRGKNFLKVQPQRRLVSPFSECSFLPAGTYVVSMDRSVSTAWRFMYKLYDIDGNAITTSDAITSLRGFGIYYNAPNKAYQWGNAINTYYDIIETPQDCYIGVNYYFNSVDVTVSNAQIEAGETRTEYEPYFEPITLSIPPSVTLADETSVDLKFAKVGDIADSLTVDRVQGKVTYTERVYYTQVTGNEIIYAYNTDSAYLYNTPMKSGYVQNGYCSVFPNGISAVSSDEPRVQFGLNNKGIYFRSIVGDGKPFVSTYAFIQYLKREYANGTPVILETELAEYVNYDLTDTELGQNLLALATQNQTNIIEITSSPSVSYLSVNYAKWGNI